MSLDTLMSRLDGVKRTGQGRWMAKCPAHDDRHPSLAIRELDDGRILLHDFGGCDTADVLDAVGLTFSDLYPERTPDQHYRPEHRPFPATDVLRAIAFEVLVVLATANTLRGQSLTQTEQDRLVVAASRIQAALTMAGANHV